jgi:hypothetical protein
MPAFTLGGTISGSGNQINNIVIGNSTPLAGSFTTLTSGTYLATVVGGNAIVAQYNASNAPVGMYVGGSSGGTALGGNVTWSSGNSFNIATTGNWWFWGNVGGVGGYAVALSAGNGTAGANANYVSNAWFALTATGQVQVLATTASTSTSTGSLVVTGGAGIAGAAYIGGTLGVPGTTTPIFTSTAAITTGAGSSAGTLTNAPAAGNPTKWIPISDNGTTRYIPAW